MGWLPTEYSDTVEFLLAPISTPYTLVYAATHYTTGQGKTPDWQANLRNTAIWTGMAGITFAWNAVVHPGKYPFMSGSAAMRTVGHLVPPAAFVPLALAAPLAAGYAVNVQVAKQMEPHQQRTFWQSVSQALTGTGTGVGSGMSGYVG